MPDFPKTIYVYHEDDVDVDDPRHLFARINKKDLISQTMRGNLVAIYTLKEVKKKVTNVTLEEI